MLSSVQSLSHVRLFETLWTAASQASLSITNSRSLLKLLSIESEMPSNHLVLCHLLLLLPSIFPSTMSQSFTSRGQSIRASASVLPMNIQDWFPLRIDWFDLLAVQRTFRSLQHHSLKASILQCSSFFMAQLSYPYMTTGRTIALTRWAFVSKGMSLLFNMLSRFVTAFLPRSKRLLLSWLKPPSAEILKPTASIVSPSIWH